MWYVIQTLSGQEQEVITFLKNSTEKKLYSEYLIALYEDVWRRDGVGHIAIRNLFPGYVFVDTNTPEELHEILLRIPRFSRILHSEDDTSKKTFFRLTKDDEDFIKTLFPDGLMQVSFINRIKTGRIERIIGPLSHYRNHIVKLDIPHRRAIVQTELFGKVRRIKFGLWTKDDPKLPRFENADSSTKSGIRADINAMDIGVHIGDKVKDETGIYGDMVFEVTDVDVIHRIVNTKAEMFGMLINIKMNADEVRKSSDL